MAKKKVIWSKRAHQDRMEILDYWVEHNQSKKYNEKLFNLFREATNLISQYPNIGRPADLQKTRIKTVRDYLMIYKE